MDLIIFLILMVVTYISGAYMERRHFAKIAQEEEQLLKKIHMVNTKQSAREYAASEPQLCCAEVVIGCSYFKRVIANIKLLFGGRLPTIDTLIERARREALVRMLKEADKHNANTVLNVRIETMTIGRGFGDKGLSCVEAFAYATACKV